MFIDVRIPPIYVEWDELQYNGTHRSSVVNEEKSTFADRT